MEESWRTPTEHENHILDIWWFSERTKGVRYPWKEGQSARFAIKFELDTVREPSLTLKRASGGNFYLPSSSSQFDLILHFFTLSCSRFLSGYPTPWSKCFTKFDVSERSIAHYITTDQDQERRLHADDERLPWTFYGVEAFFAHDARYGQTALHRSAISGTEALTGHLIRNLQNKKGKILSTMLITLDELL